jgi:tetrapyrrole methylase family protein/MazG family protein
MLEECYEVLDAVDAQNKVALKEELGDLLFQVFFMAKVCEINGDFDINDVTDNVVRKMISRHTHIFGDDTSFSAKDVEAIWEKNKKTEKAYKSVYDKLSQIPQNLPALIRAEKVLAKSAEVENTDISENIYLIEESLKNLSNWPECEKMEKMGLILLQISDISRKLQINTEFALTKAVKTYINKFEHIEKPLDC